MRQTELHLVAGMESGMRSAHGREDAGRVAPGFLHRGREEAREDRIGRSEETSGGSMEKKSAAVALVIV